MATIDSKQIIDGIIAANGKQYSDEPSVYQIVEYTNAYGNITWGVTWVGEANPRKYELETYYVRNPRVIWRINESD